MSFSHYKPGWRPDVPDLRDFKYKIQYRGTLPDSVSNRDFLPREIWDQETLGSCSAWAVNALLEYNRIQQGGEAFMPSALFAYYNTRLLQGSVNEDSGAEIRTAVQSVVKYGVCREALWPYKIDRFKNKPLKTAYKAAEKFKALTYYRLDNTKLNVLKNCLANKECFVFGAMIYQSFMDACERPDGKVPMPTTVENSFGGHAMLACGYTPTHFIIRNSWGEKCGDRGYMYMPHAYLTNTELSDDFWTISTVS